MSQPSPSSWYLAQLKPNSLKIALRNLTRQGFECFAPMHETTRRRAGRFVTATAPLFPGYIFVRIDEPGGVRTVNGTLGVTSLVSFAGRAAQVPDGLVQGLRARCNDENLLQAQRLNVGDMVTITRGPLAGFVGRIDRLAPDQRVWVLLDMMGRQTLVRAPATVQKIA